MKMKNLIAFAALVLGVVAAPFAAMAHSYDTKGDIYSIDLDDQIEYGGMIPTAAKPAAVTDQIVFRVRFANPDYAQSGGGEGWLFAPKQAGMEKFFNPKLGILLGENAAEAEFIDQKTSAGRTYTDLFFRYTVKSGDLALPALLMGETGKPATSGVSYKIYNSEYWELTSEFHKSETEVIKVTANWTYGPDNRTIPEAGEPTRTIDGTALGAYVKTVDFDANYAVKPDPLVPTDEGIWRRVQRGMAATTTVDPSIIPDARAESASRVFIWVDEEEYAIPYGNGAYDEELLNFDGTKSGKTRRVLPVTISAGDTSVSFKLWGLKNTTAGTPVRVCLGSSPNNVWSGAGDPITNWVSRVIEVVDPDDPTLHIQFVDASGRDAVSPLKVTPGFDYKTSVGGIKFTIVPAATNAVTVNLAAALAGTGNLDDIFEKNLIGLSEAGNWYGKDKSVTIPVGGEKTLKLFAFGYTTKTLDTAIENGIDFTASCTDEGVKVDPASSLKLYLNKSTIEVKDVMHDETIVPGSKATFRMRLDDCYMNLHSTVGYTVSWEMDGEELEDSTDVTWDEDDEEGVFVMKKKINGSEGEHEVKIVVYAPDGKTKSAPYKFKINLSSKKKIVAVLGDGMSNGICGESDKTVIPVTIMLQGGSYSEDDTYAFLVPKNAATSNAVDLTVTGIATGMKVPEAEKEGEFPIKMKFLDGDRFCEFDVVLSKKPNKIDEIVSFSRSTFTMTVSNLIAQVKSVAVGGTKVSVDGETLKGKNLAVGVPTKFSVQVQNEVSADLDAPETKFKTRWTFNGGTPQVMEGNPNNDGMTQSWTPTSSGLLPVTVEFQDKDMNGEWSDPFTFYVNVLDAPSIAIEPLFGDQYHEDQSGFAKSKFTVTLNIPPIFSGPNDRLVVDLKLTRRGTNEEVEERFAKLSDKKLYFSSGVSEQTFFFEDFDGTLDSERGYEIHADVNTAESAADEEGKVWKNAVQQIIIINNDPVINSPKETLDKDGKVEIRQTEKGTPITLDWSISDIEADLTNGLVVTWTTSESKTFVTNAATGSYTFTFDTAGTGKYITLKVRDKDGGTAERTFYYTVSSSHTLRLVPHGPQAGNGTANSKRYRTAEGLGEGRVYAAGLSGVENFESVYNAGGEENSTWRVYAYGYKVGEIDGERLYKYPKYNVPIDKDGNPKGENPGYDYNAKNYRDKNGNLVDSFRYTWLSLTRSSENSSLVDCIMGDTVSPEYGETVDNGTLAGLVDPHTPTGANGSDNNSSYLIYDDTLLEAIFSREYLASDNMGDINYDGIPDIYVDKYGFGVVNPTTGTLAEEGKDLEKQDSFNDDEDYLPTFGSTNCVPFDAKTEIRGYGEGLNDAPVLAGISGVKPDKVYLNPDPTAKDYCPSSTLSKVEYLAWLDYKAAHPTATADDWSPERPTDPTVADTDGDGFDDGFEYYFWYMAHVGYMDGNVHRYLTGRRYDPKNPGEGTLITPEEIAERMDPLVKYSGPDAQTRDTDNDGLPDLLEFELGTNPFDFDTDGDGLPDGWEVMISKTDPLKWATDDKTCDAMLNTDGDAMAFTTPKLEESVSPKPFDIAVPVVFAVMDADGDSDGVQWYAVTTAPAVTTVTNEAAKAWGFRLVGDKRNYIAYEKPVLTADGILANTLAKGSGTKESSFRGAFVAGELSTVTNISEDETETNVFNYAACGFPVRIEAGTRIDAKSVTSNVTAIVSRLAEAIPADAANACWTYGATGVGDGENSGFGKLAIGRNQAVAEGALVVSAPAADENVAYLHYLVYQQFGFDPRTAWNAKTPLASRWSTATAGKATRTREYTAYDEFLLLSFFLNNGTLDAADVTPTQASDWERIWKACTTNPNLDTNGADTDGDGVPDGWELYVMSGPKQNGKFVFPGLDSNLSPFVGDAKKDSTDNKELSGDGDGLTEYQEFEGTDTMAHYGSVAPANLTIKHDSEWKWFNKFFPTDPWNTDTDNDGLSDANEIKNAGGFNAKNFLYAESDTGKTCVPGGGLNPCSVDTDQDGLPDGWEAQFAGSTLSPASTNTVAGLIDGMDGTVKDAFTTVNQPIDRDYDHDGLDNWQEYLVGAMRCWRYDDPISRWTSIPTEYYFDEQGDFNPFREDGKYLALLGIDTSAEDGGVGEFWYRTLFDKESRAYNPRLVTDTCSGALYFSRVTNGFDPNFTDAGAYYIFYDRIGDQKLADLWGGAPKKYISCSPLKADTDGDGMDDYYELFHGLNPILGQDRTPVSSSGGCDIIFDAWGASDSSISALNNAWTMDPLGKLGRQPRTNDPANNKFDFELFPWLNGLESADADGDDIRNQDEAIMPMLSPQSTWHHTDPSALWFTDSSYTNSLVNRFYRMPATYSTIVLPGKTFTFEGETYSFTKADGYRSAGNIAPLKIDQWDLTSDSSQNWMFSFEENEGYDTDHDGISDFEELQGKPTGTVSDPQNHDSPHHRQAMYFAGEENPSALQSMPFFAEEHPRYGAIYPDDMSFLQYTVECWVRPEEVSTSKGYTILERAIWSSYSAAGDEELLRKNFQLAIRRGCWYTKFDANGTLKDSVVELQSTVPAKPGEWAHLAATYDGAILRLYVNGVEALKNGVSGRGLKPEYGSSAVVVHPGDDMTKTNGLYLGRANSYWYDREYKLHAFILGASAKNQTDLGGPTKLSNSHLNVANGCGWGYYKDFFKGYIDEVRIWDGARTADKIKADMTKHYAADDAKQNRNDFYDQWAEGKRRYDKDGNGNDQNVIPELRYHWSFDSLPGAENPEMAAKSAHGYGYVKAGQTHAGSKAPLARPLGYEIDWWKTILEGYKGTVYDNPAYVMWVPNTVTHLPRFDSTTLDSFYWAQDTEGIVRGSHSFAQTAEPVSRWVQYKRQGSLSKSTDFRTTSRRFWQVNVNAASNPNAVDSASKRFEFTGRHLNQIGDDLLPLGGAFVKYVDEMWDDQGASSSSEITGTDENNNGLADWWEKHAKENYSPENDPIVWTTFVTYRGRRITAGEAYLLDLAKGLYADENGNIVTDPDQTKRFINRADEDKDGIPDWWEKHYGIHTGDVVPVGMAHANEDPDNDGLSNYNEYLLSEVFDFAGHVFNPMKACSVDPSTPDYFYRVGELYVGEIFTDHDLVDDAWEDLYPASYASRLAWDAFADSEEDGWSNRSECRSHYWGSGFFPDIIDTFIGGSIDSQLRCFPQPAIRLHVSYNGHLDPAWSSLIIRTRTGDKNRHDATFQVDSLKKAGDNNDQGGMEKTQVLGIYSGRPVMRGYLDPGCIVPSSVKIQKTAISSELRYFWACTECGTDHVGSYAEYKADIDHHGEAKTDPNGKGVTLNKTSSVWDTFVAARGGSDGQHGVFHFQDGDSGAESVEEVGTINYRTGEYRINLDLLKKKFDCDFDGMAFKASFAYAPGAYWPQTFYLSYPEQGYVREGKNVLEAFFDLNEDGEWQPGEPYGIVHDVNVSWEGATAEIELTDISPVTPRIMLVGSTGGDEQKTSESESFGASGNDPSSDRAKTFDQIREEIRASGTGSGWVDINKISPAEVSVGFKGQRIRVVRWIIGYSPVYRSSVNARVVLDKTINTDVRGCLTEADILSGNENIFDLDWSYLRSEVITNPKWSSTDIRRVIYLVVVGDGAVSWKSESDTTEVIALPSVIIRYFGSTHVKPVAVAPGAVNEEIVHSANPTFKWTMGCPEEEGYTAFNVQVLDGTTLVYDSGKQFAPPRNIYGEYVWSAPLYVGDKTTSGKVFENKKVYTWKVSMYNAKFSNTENYSDPGKFFMEVQTNGTAYGTANVAVRYFGPSETYTNKNPVIRVQAFTSPDFTGKPVAAGYVANPSSAANGLAVANREVTANCQVVGLEPGSYYLQAFIDSNGNGICDRWETQGYLCTRDGSTSEYLDPVSINFGTTVGQGDLAIIYLEDADTDADGLPDAWEYAMYGSLTAKGVELLTETKAGEQLYNKALTKGEELKLQNGAFLPIGGLEGLLGSRFLNNAGMVSLAMGAPNAGNGDFTEAIEAALAPDLAEGGVTIRELGLRDGKVTVALGIETTSGAESPLAKFFGTSGKLTVVCEILWTPSLAQAPKVIYSEDVVVGDAPVEFNISAALQKAQAEAGVNGDSAFFSAKVYKR